MGLPRRLLIPLVLCLAHLAAVTPSEATRTRALTLQEMSQRAETIFLGRCDRVRTERDLALGLDVTVTEFIVTRAVKGHVGSRVVVRSLGDGFSIAGRPTYKPGEEVVLFLYGASRRGLTSPVGLGQGKFSVVADKEGRRLAVNAFGNEGLFEQSHRGGPGGQEGHRPAGRGSGTLSPEALLDLVQSMGR